MTNEIKLLSVSPSVKNWPVSLILGALVTLTGLISLVLLITSAQTALLIACVGVSLTVWPVLQASNTEYFVSNVRVVVRGGLLSKKERYVPIHEIKEVRIRRTSMQETLGIGDLDLIGPSGTFALEGVEEPDKVREKILSLR